jgi:hypothetical protein
MDEEFQSQAFNNPPSQFNGPMDLFSVIWLYPIFSFMLMAVNLFFIVHAIKSGRPYYWVWLIFMMPVLGAAAYFFVEMRPNFRRTDWADLRWRFATPAQRIAVLSESATESPTVKNRTRLALEHESQGRWEQSSAIYRECLTGVFDNDPRLMISLATSLLEEGKDDEAYKIATQIPAQRDFKLDDDRKLVLYRSQSCVGQLDSAIEGLENLAARKSGFSARYYLAQAKIANGNHEEANAELEKIVKTYRNGNALLRRHEQQWYLDAKKLLKRKLG